MTHFNAMTTMRTEEHNAHARKNWREICDEFANDAIVENGINWTHAIFDDGETAKRFENAMTASGYETRGVNAPIDNDNPNLIWWRVQFR